MPYPTYRFWGVLLSLFVIPFPLFGVEKYTVDPVHSVVQFSVRHLMVTNVKGVFRDFSGTIYLDEKDLTKSRAEGSIRVESIDTGIKKRDDHLRSPDFFNAGTFPEIRYQTTRIEPKGENRFVVYGKLTIRDVTKEIPLDVEYMGKVVGMDGKPRIGFHAEGKINRKDFKVLWDKRLDNGAIVVGDEVKISLDIEAVQE